MKILITPTSFKPDGNIPALDQLRSFADTLVFNPQSRPMTEDELILMLEGCDGCIAGLDSFTRKVIENTQKLKVISRYGIGIDNIDMAASRSKNIVVCNTPGVNAHAVADLTFGLLLCVARKISALDRYTKAGKWTRSIGIELFGKTIGILGLGAVGKAVANRAAGFSMRILAYDPYINEEYAEKKGIISADFGQVIKEADFLCLHQPLTGETSHIINHDVMSAMKKDAIIVNTARGGLIDENAAYQLLKSGHLGGVGLDVYETEPPGVHPLFALDNVVVTPHTSAHTAEAITGMAYMAVQNMIDVLSGKVCRYIVE